MDIKVTIDISPESANNLAAAFSKIGVGGGSIQGSATTETSTVGQTGTKTEKVAPKTAKAEKPAAPAVTLEDLRAVATECVNAGKKDKLVEINKSFGATGLSKIEPDKYPEVLKALKALAKEAAEEEEDPTA